MARAHRTGHDIKRMKMQHNGTEALELGAFEEIDETGLF